LNFAALRSTELPSFISNIVVLVVDHGDSQP
jgi:hypothetical protein